MKWENKGTGEEVPRRKLLPKGRVRKGQDRLTKGRILPDGQNSQRGGTEVILDRVNSSLPKGVEVECMRCVTCGPLCLSEVALWENSGGENAFGGI